MRTFCKFRNSCPKVLHETSSSENFGKFSAKNSSWGPNLIKLWNQAMNINKPYSTTSAFLGVCRGFKNSHSVK